MSGRSSKTKGKRGELEAAAALRKCFGGDIERTQQYCGRSGTGDLTGMPGVHLEVKRCESGNPYRWLDQAKRDAEDGQIPVVLHRRSREEWIVVVELGHLKRLAERLTELWES